MNAAEALASHRAMINEIGEDIIIRRYSGAAGPNRAYTDTIARARIVGYQPRDLVGGISQGDRKAIVLVDTLGALLPIVPGRDSDDKAVVRGKEISIIAVDDSTRRIGGTLIALELQVRG
jgi:hypothetical protein